MTSEVHHSARTLRVGFCQVVVDDDLDSYPFLGFGYLKTYAERHCRFPLTFEYCRNWRDLSPDCDVIGLSSLSQDYEEVRLASNELHSRGHQVIIGGVHISERPGDLPASAAAAVLYEGEATFANLLQLYGDEGRLAAEKLAAIPGVAFWNTDQNGERTLVVTAARSSLAMDDLPFPDRRFLGKSHHGLHMFTSRGCTYKCSFCSSTAYWKKFRSFSPEYVVDEVAHLAETFPEQKRLTLADDLFVADRRRMRRIVDLLEKRGLRTRFRMNCAIRIDHVDSELCDMLVGFNAEFVYFGLESGSQRIQEKLKHYRRGVDVTPKQMRPALALLASRGITTNTTFIVGCPGEEHADLASTYDFLAEQTGIGHLSEAIANVLTPLPGTGAWDEAVARGDISAPFEWSRLRYYAYLGKHHPSHVSVNEWAELRRRNRSVYVNPSMHEDNLYEVMHEREAELERLREGRRRAPLWGETTCR